MSDARIEESTPKVIDRQSILSDLANRLQKKRITLTLSLEEISYKLKIRNIYLEALESGDWKDMPEDVYALGFLRQYASFLQENIDIEISQIKNETIKLTRPLTFPDPAISPNKSWVVIAFLTFIVLFIFFNIFNNSEPNLKPTTIQNSEPQPILKEKPLQEEIPIIIPPKQEATVKVIKDTVSTPTPLQPSKYHYRFYATNADVWLQVLKPKKANEPKKIIREVLLKAGEYFSIYHDSTYLLLNCGNILALQVEIDGKKITEFKGLGNKQKIVRDFILAAQ